MSNPLKVNHPAPELQIDSWVQGEAGTLEQEKGKVVLIEVFQVNCPGCFIGGLPEAIAVYEKFQSAPLTVWGLATAFEDHDKNSIENLKKLLTRGEVVGDTLAELGRRNLLNFDRLIYSIPFPVAWDKVVPAKVKIDDEAVKKIIDRDIPQFEKLAPEMKKSVIEQVESYLLKKTHTAHTFETYQLRGTPSAILIDKKGNLRECLFGSSLELEEKVSRLLDE